MNDFDSENPSENEWEEQGGLAWNEFDWERYLREQDEAIHRYLGFYDAFKDSPNRIDDVAEHMGWGQEEIDEKASEADVAKDEFSQSDEIYTLHKNPVFISTKAIYLGLRRQWELTACDASQVPQPIAITYLAALHRGEDHANQAIHALDFGDYSMAVCLFKRALGALNDALAFLGSSADKHKAVALYRDQALPRLFDLREIWLRVITECREELARPQED